MVNEKLFLYLQRSNKKQTKEQFKMTMCYLHMNAAMRMWTMITTTMTPRG